MDGWRDWWTVGKKTGWQNRLKMMLQYYVTAQQASRDCQSLERRWEPLFLKCEKGRGHRFVLFVWLQRYGWWAESQIPVNQTVQGDVGPLFTSLYLSTSQELCGKYVFTTVKWWEVNRMERSIMRLKTNAEQLYIKQMTAHFPFLNFYPETLCTEPLKNIWLNVICRIKINMS